MVLIAGGCTTWFSVSIFRAFTQGDKPEEMEQRYTSIIPHTDAPPGYKAIRSGRFPIVGFEWVYFAPEITQAGDMPFVELLVLSETGAILIKNPEDSEVRKLRDDVFSANPSIHEGSVVATFLEMRQAHEWRGASEGIVTGTLGGHAVPLRYAILPLQGSDVDIQDPNAGEPVKINQRRRGRPRTTPVRSEYGIVDLTPESAKEQSVQFIVWRSDGEKITPELLSELCKNFKIGQ